MSALDQAKYHLFQKITALIGNDNLVDDIVIDYPPEPQLGDLTLACFVLAKLKQRPPAEVAAELAAKLTPDEIVAASSAAGPYVNFLLRADWLAKKSLAEINAAYGQSDSGRQQAVLVEYSNVNTHKEYHVGHLRNLCYGDAVAKILAAAGFKVTAVSYVNDFGIHAAKTLWQLKRSSRTDSTSGGYYLGQLYAAAAAALEKDPAGQQEVAVIMANIESRRGPDYKLWRQTRRWSINYFAQIYQRLKIKFAHIYYESEVVDQGRELVKKLLAQGVLKISDGAVIADLSAADLGVLVLLRSDGTALYPVADLALAARKFSDRTLNKSIYVVDKRQSLYFRQLFKILELAGYRAEMVHLAYDFVRLPEGMMSSRSGRVATVDDVYERLAAALKNEVAKRHPDWSERQLTATAAILTRAVLKFEMIKVGAEKIITFDLKEALRFDGFTAVYLLYSVARINSLFKKAKIESARALPQLLTQVREKELLLTLAKYPEIVRQAAAAYEPSVVAKYLFDTAQQFNDYYQSTPVIQADKKLMLARLALAGAARQVLTNGLALLGIEAVEEM